MVLFKTRGGVANGVAGGEFYITSALNIIYYEVEIQTGYFEGEFKTLGYVRLYNSKRNAGRKAFIAKPVACAEELNH